MSQPTCNAQGFTQRGSGLLGLLSALIRYCMHLQQLLAMRMHTAQAQGCLGEQQSIN